MAPLPTGPPICDPHWPSQFERFNVTSHPDLGAADIFVQIIGVWLHNQISPVLAILLLTPSPKFRHLPNPSCYCYPFPISLFSRIFATPFVVTPNIWNRCNIFNLTQLHILIFQFSAALFFLRVKSRFPRTLNWPHCCWQSSILLP